LNAIDPVPSEIIIDIEELKNRARLIENPPEPKKKINPITTKFVDIEKEDLWNECIIGTGDSYLKGLIDSLGNMDWFRYGYASYFEKSDGKCPFCQRMLPNNFKEECEKIFDLEYKNKIQRLEGLFEQYEQRYHYSISFDESIIDNSELKKAIELFRSVYEKNKNAINEKMRNPSVAIKLDPLDEKVAVINGIINVMNQEADIFNSRLGNPQKERDDILGLFWKWVEKQYHDDIIQYKEYSKRLNEEMKAHANKAESYQKEINVLNQDILENTEKLVSLQTTIANINNEIDSLGLSDFHIIENPENPGHFKIQRDEETSEDDVYKTLSEGEKTLITFLYFLELCKGGVNKSKVNALVNKIIVIDDPISSLSQNYVYEISYLIANTFTQGKNIIPEQLLIFTHNLFFFYEISEHQLDKYLKKYEKATNGPYPFFRIRKNKASEIILMGKDEIQNDYQSAWLLYKECLEGKAPVRLLPNTMRNILEYYFSFVKRKGKLQKALEELSCEDADFKPFYRFINRGSHSDIVNISEFKDIDTGKYQVLFKKIFEKTGFVDHYNAMMGIAEEGA
jgi:wobble nucleotide-excising tRNase